MIEKKIDAAQGLLDLFKEIHNDPNAKELWEIHVQCQQLLQKHSWKVMKSLIILVEAAIKDFKKNHVVLYCLYRFVKMIINICNSITEMVRWENKKDSFSNVFNTLNMFKKDLNNFEKEEMKEIDAERLDVLVDALKIKYKDRINKLIKQLKD